MTRVKNACYKCFIIILFIPICIKAKAVNGDSVYVPNIYSVRLHTYGDQTGLPLLSLGSNDLVELHFDDLNGGVKYYYYTYQLCNADWKPVNVSQFDYIKGFTQMRFTTYRFSSIAYTRYTHYQAILPEKGSQPIRSGNYIIKAFLDGDTSKVVFTKRLLVLNNKATISARITQPFLPEYFRTHQKLQFNININGLNTFSATQQIKVAVLQNNRWDNAYINIPPTFIRGTSLEYNTENIVFPGGKEWRWLDIRDFRLQTDRVKSADYKKTSTDIFVKPDAPRSGEKYIFYQDLNGMYTIENTQGLNPYWQSDYADVYFSMAGENVDPNKNIYLFGQLTNYSLNDSLKLQFDPAKNVYQTRLLLKQGYYSYGYIQTDKGSKTNYKDVDGSYYETENSYTILVYFKDFASRADELIGVSTIDSKSGRPGFSF